jgi:hypothetical protein
MVAEIETKGTDVEIAGARPLFVSLFTDNVGLYDVSDDRQHILAVTPDEQAVPEPLTLVQNWVAGSGNSPPSSELSPTRTARISSDSQGRVHNRLISIPHSCRNSRCAVSWNICRKL